MSQSFFSLLNVPIPIIKPIHQHYLLMEFHFAYFTLQFLNFHINHSSSSNFVLCIMNIHNSQIFHSLSFTRCNLFVASWILPQKSHSHSLSLTFIPPIDCRCREFDCNQITIYNRETGALITPNTFPFYSPVKYRLYFPHDT